MENLLEKIAQLLNKAEWTDDEKQWLLRYLEDTDSTEFRRLMEQQFESDRNEEAQVNSELAKSMLQELMIDIGIVQNINKVPVINMRRRLMALGAIVVLLTVCIFIFSRKNTRKEIVKTPVHTKFPVKEQAPASNKVVLTMADGRSVELGDKNIGTIAEQGNSRLFNKPGKLVYSEATANNAKILYNTVTTPAGTNYQVTLPDGSQVWLNAASSLHFPTSFTGRERRVDITGEAYFEVTKNEAMPFIVNVQGAEIRVAGTHFNVMAYANEAAIKTTLLEGAVVFVNGDNNCVLKPGQQGQLTKSRPIKLVSGIDVAEVVAWKNGLFDFDGADIETVARQLSRWYDVQMVFDKTIHNRFYAKIPRSTKLTDVLKALELTGKVQFTIEGNKIFTMPAE